MLGDHACAEGAILAGCRFFAGYPITPATEIAERMSVRLPQVAGNFMQMEDELASMNAVLGGILGRDQVHDSNQRSWFFPDDGKSWPGNYA